MAAYDPVLRRPACVLLQAAFGGDRQVCFLFPPGAWLLTPTKTLRMVGGTREQWEALATLPPVEARDAE